MSIEEKLITISENEQRVYDAGERAYWSSIWEAIQIGGTRTSYNKAFKNSSWNDTNFRPKYDITTQVSYGECFMNSRIVNLKKCLAYNGVKIDFSNCTGVYNMFGSMPALEYVGVVDFSENTNITNYSTLFYLARALKSVDLIKVRSDGIEQNWDSTYGQCHELANVMFEGVIWGNFNMLWCEKLTTDSMKSIIGCLKNVLGTAEEGTKKLTFHSTCWSRLEADSTAPNGGTWRNYVEYSLGWTT